MCTFYAKMNENKIFSFFQHKRWSIKAKQNSVIERKKNVLVKKFKKIVLAKSLKNGDGAIEAVGSGREVVEGRPLRLVARTSGQRKLCDRQTRNSPTHQNQGGGQNRRQKCSRPGKFEENFSRDWNNEKFVSPVDHPALPGHGDGVDDLHCHRVCQQRRHFWLFGKLIYIDNNFNGCSGYMTVNLIYIYNLEVKDILFIQSVAVVGSKLIL